ncbi:MAG: HlyD family efflux transporter periplasmic adaptor subunit [Myxococcales bacterium]|nr:HlyD family efflux transporter periplasmic adaptor subunit [Myxococcales bacterium]
MRTTEGRAVVERVHPDNPGAGPALARIRRPASVRWMVLFLAVFVPASLLAAVFVPWQQTASATGAMIAFAPEEREQVVEAPVSGRIVHWFVSEGQPVQEGDPLVEIRDNDPELLGRLGQAREAASANESAVKEQIASYQRKVEAAVAGRDLVIAEKEAGVQESLRKRVGEAAELEAAERDLQRVETLAAEGIASTRELDVARMKERKARAALEARDREVASKEQARDKAGADADAKIASARAELDAARGKLAEARNKVLDSDVKLARQQAQVVKAPRSGVVLRLHGGLGGGQLKAGDAVATIVPEASARAAELYLDGNDMPFVKQGTEVRLVFQGWPAVQFVGLPGTGQGTFHGRLSFIDAAANSKGKFRAVVVPGAEDDWPVGLRQGVQVKGFLLLGQVPLGYELWRQLNGFPPQPDVEKGEATPLPSTKKPRTPTELK